eukprot:TRINITY_DN1269_c0_g3_i1.p1 TRINITY_DN1269_c0_g3~~TRINITY_DN1269_c0_g3_i1.p1  ORF type:complete len:889 (+),score=246.64 TRINITY_DN1269_c0_g3_i1:53-2719(+)
MASPAGSAAGDACFKVPDRKRYWEEGLSSVLVVRGWGRDRPGVTKAFMEIAAAYECKVNDMSQFLLDSSLMFTFVLSVGDRISTHLMKALTECAKELDLHLDFHFRETRQVEEVKAGRNVAVISVVSSGAITPALLYDLDAVLCEHGCSVYEIDHRSDNKKEFNNEYSKVQMRVGSPKGVKLATLFLGTGSSSSGLQKVAWSHGAEAVIRWWNAMNRPIGKSLVVFGLSQVLCPTDVLDEVLKEAGVAQKAIDGKDANGLNGVVNGNGGSEQVLKETERKVRLLKDVSVDVVQRVIDRLEYTPGARLVCGTLKRMGFRVAILSNTGMYEVAEHVKRQLGLDYTISRGVEVVDGRFTGRYTGDEVDVHFHKADLLKLMADREGIEHRNVVLVGEPLKGLKAGTAMKVFDSFGPNVWFNSDKLKDLTIALYLLGFNGVDVRALRKRKWEDCDPSVRDALDSSPSDVQPGKRLKLQLSSKSRDPGQIRSILKVLSQPGSALQLATARQCSLQDGGMCLGLDIRMGDLDPEQTLKDVLLSCHREGFQVLDFGHSNNSAPSAPSAPSWTVYYQNRHVITLVQKPQIESTSLFALCSMFHNKDVNIVKIERLSMKGMAAMHFVVTLPSQMEASEISALLAEIARSHNVDIAMQRDDVERWMRRLIVFDMDSTLIQQEVIDELAKYAGVEEQVKTITEAAMRGELNFFESLKTRVDLLKGQDAEMLFSRVKANLVFTPGAKKLCSTLKSLGYKMAVISGGFLPIAHEVQRHLGLDYAFANTLEVDEAGLLTGRTTGPVVTPQRKRALLAMIANVEGCEVEQTIAVGDGSNDIPMLNTAGLGIAFCAKPKVQEATEFRINQKDLSTVLYLIGISEHAAAGLAVSPSAEDLKREGAL